VVGLGPPHCTQEVAQLESGSYTAYPSGSAGSTPGVGLVLRSVAARDEASSRGFAASVGPAA
jgi:hypothetical protein